MKLTDSVYLVGSGAQGIGISDDFDCHIYLIDGGSESGIVDAGAGLDVDRIVSNMRAHGLDPSRVRHLLLTHAHGDHAGGAAARRRGLAPDVTVYSHADCAAYVREGDETAISLAEAKRVGIYPPDYRFEPCPVDVELREGDTVSIGPLTLSTVETPGHCGGHVSFLMEQNGRTHFFGGDLVFFGGTVLLQNIWDCDLQAQIRSLEKLRRAEVDLFLPGHRGFCLDRGQQQIDAALRFTDGLLIPPNFTYGW